MWKAFTCPGSSKSNRAPLLYYIKLCASLEIQRWIQTAGTVWKRPIWVKIGIFFFFFFCPAWPWNLTDDCEKQYIKLCASFQSHVWIHTGVTVRKRLIGVKIDDFFVPRDLEIWRMTLKNNKELLCCLKLCALFHSHQWIQSGATFRKCPI